MKHCGRGMYGCIVVDVWCGDGGGNKAWMSIACWATLRHIKYSIDGKIFDPKLLVGTSANGMFAPALAQYQLPAYLLSKAQELSDQIFSRSFWQIINFNLTAPKYGSSGRLKALQSIIRESRHDDIPWGVTSYPFFQRASFGSMAGNLLLTERDCSPVEAAMRTSAAPTFFPAWNGWIDGAFEDNNPVVEAILFAERLAPGDHHHVLSLGCGRQKHQAPRGAGRWGVTQWLPHIAEAFMGADNMRSENELREKLPGIKYTVVRFQRELPVPVAMDDSGAVPDLIQWGREMADPKYSYTIRSSK